MLKEEKNMEIFLQPAGDVAKKQLQITIYRKEKLDKLQEYVTVEQYNELKELYPNEELNMWGVTINKENVWNEMKIGDLVLFYGNRKFFVKGSIKYKIHNSELARNIWGTDSKGLCWEYIFFLDNAQNINVSLEEFNKITGYNFKHVQGAMRVRQNYREKIVKKYEKIFNIDYQNIKYQEEQTRIQKLKNQIWNLDIENTNDNFKIVTINGRTKKSTSKKTVKRNYNKNKKEKNNVIEYLSDEDKYHLGVLGELYIYKLLNEGNTSLLKKLNLLNKEIDIDCYNKEYNNQKDWQDKSINKGHDILIKVKEESEEIYLEVKTSIEDTRLFSMTGNELRLSRNKGKQYYIVKIANFVDINRHIDKSKLKFYFIQNPYQLIENGDSIKEISIYLND